MKDYEESLTEGSRLLLDIKKLKRSLNEVEAIAKAGESPFQALSYLKSDIEDVMKAIALKKY